MANSKPATERKQPSNAMKYPPLAVVIAGPNGSGKTTAAEGLLPRGMKFINADLIAQEMTGEIDTAGDINAGRLLIQEVSAAEDSREDFAFETTLASRALLNRILKWKSLGYQLHIIYFWLQTPDLAVERVAARVRLGGHDVPEATIRRRYLSGLHNLFEHYLEVADTWRLYDNSRPTGLVPIASFTHDEGCIIKHEALFEEMRSQSLVHHPDPIALGTTAYQQL